MEVLAQSTVYDCALSSAVSSNSVTPSVAQVSFSYRSYLITWSASGWGFHQLYSQRYGYFKEKDSANVSELQRLSGDLLSFYFPSFNTVTKWLQRLLYIFHLRQGHCDKRDICLKKPHRATFKQASIWNVSRVTKARREQRRLILDWCSAKYKLTWFRRIIPLQWQACCSLCRPLVGMQFSINERMNPQKPTIELSHIVSPILRFRLDVSICPCQGACAEVHAIASTFPLHPLIRQQHRKKKCIQKIPLHYYMTATPSSICTRMTNDWPCFVFSKASAPWALSRSKHPMQTQSMTSRSRSRQLRHPIWMPCLQIDSSSPLSLFLWSQLQRRRLSRFNLWTTIDFCTRQSCCVKCLRLRFHETQSTLWWTWCPWVSTTKCVYIYKVNMVKARLPRYLSSILTAAPISRPNTSPKFQPLLRHYGWCAYARHGSYSLVNQPPMRWRNRNLFQPEPHTHHLRPTNLHIPFQAHTLKIIKASDMYSRSLSRTRACTLARMFFFWGILLSFSNEHHSPEFVSFDFWVAQVVFVHFHLERTWYKSERSTLCSFSSYCSTDRKKKWSQLFLLHCLPHPRQSTMEVYPSASLFPQKTCSPSLWSGRASPLPKHSRWGHTPPTLSTNLERPSGLPID